MYVQLLYNPEAAFTCLMSVYNIHLKNGTKDLHNIKSYKSALPVSELTSW